MDAVELQANVNRVLFRNKRRWITYFAQRHGIEYDDLQQEVFVRVLSGKRQEVDAGFLSVLIEHVLIDLSRHLVGLRRVSGGPSESLWSFESYSNDEGGLAWTLRSANDTGMEAEQLEEKRMVRRAIHESLDERERYVVMAYYWLGLTLLEIAQSLCLVESRVCQLHKGILKKLSDFLRGQYGELAAT